MLPFLQYAGHLTDNYLISFHLKITYSRDLLIFFFLMMDFCVSWSWFFIILSSFTFSTLQIVKSFILVPCLYLCVCSCCGAGTAADTEKTTDLLSSNLAIYSLNSGRNPRVIMAVNILQDMLYRWVIHTHRYMYLEVRSEFTVSGGFQSGDRNLWC